MSARDDLGPLFGGKPLSTRRRTRRVGAPKVASDPVWASATEAERAAALVVLEALRSARRDYGMPALARARLAPSSAIPVIRRLRELQEDLPRGESAVDVLCGCARARVALHATAPDEAVRRGDYATVRVMFDDDEKWDSVLNAGRAWARGDHSTASDKAKAETQPKPRGAASHGPRR